MVNSLSILGSTGSIGTQTLDVVDKLNLKVSALTASTNIKLLEEQVRKYKPELAVVFNEEKAKEFKDNISTIREFSKEDPKIWLPKLTELLSKCGIVLVLLPHMKGSYLHGASFYDGNHIVLGVTVRGKDADKFWFSFFHESCHIIQGHISEIAPTHPEQEKEADDFARDILISPEDFDRLMKKSIITKQDIVSFSKEIKIHPSIVLGRLQKEGIIKYSQYNDLKIHYILNV